MTSAFDEDFSDTRGKFVNVNEFNDEDDDVVDNWEEVLDEEEEEEKRRKDKEAEEKRKELEKQKKLQKREEERRKQEELEAMLKAKPMSKEEQERAQLASDMQNANDLFGSDEEGAMPAVAALSVSNSLLVRNPDSVDSFVPVDSEDFTELSRRIAAKMENYMEDDGYDMFVKDLVAKLVISMSSDQIKKISAEVTKFAHEKAREEKIETTKKKTQAKTKVQLKVAKTNTSNDLLDDYAYDDHGGYGDDDYDFM